MRCGAKGSAFYFLNMVKIRFAMEYLRSNRLFLLQNDKFYSKYGHFASNSPFTVNTAQFDCLDLSGPPCTLLLLKRLKLHKIGSFLFNIFSNEPVITESFRLNY